MGKECKFKVGDIVQCFDKGFEPDIPYGSIGIIERINQTSGFHRINFEFNNKKDWLYLENELKPAKFIKSRLWRQLNKE